MHSDGFNGRMQCAKKGQLFFEKVELMRSKTMKNRLIFYFNIIFYIRKKKQVFIYIFCVSVGDDSDGGLLVRALISS